MNVSLYNDDCFKILDEMNQNNILVDCIICDPPYNISYDEWDKGFNTEKAIDLCVPILKENGNFIIFQGWSNVCKTKEYLDKELNIINWIIWDRIKGRGAKYNVVSTREDILWYCKGKTPIFNKIYSNIPKKQAGLEIMARLIGH